MRFERASRIELSARAWLEFVPDCVTGHEALFDELARAPIWTRERTRMYERTLDVPRLLGNPTPTMAAAPWIARAGRLLSERYDRTLHSVSLAYYRDGRDSVAMHGDKVGALRDDTVIAIVSLGWPRSFLLKPARGGESLRFRLGRGDLLVMGGSCQRDWLHGVPKCKRAKERISVMFREVASVPVTASPISANEAAARLEVSRAGFPGSNRRFAG